MDARQNLRTEIDKTAADLVHKIQFLEERISDMQHNVRESLSLRHQIEVHPWWVLGVAVAAGVLVGARTRSHHAQ